MNKPTALILSAFLFQVSTGLAYLKEPPKSPCQIEAEASCKTWQNSTSMYGMCVASIQQSCEKMEKKKQAFIKAHTPPPPPPESEKPRYQVKQMLSTTDQIARHATVVRPSPVVVPKKKTTQPPKENKKNKPYQWSFY